MMRLQGLVRGLTLAILGLMSAAAAHAQAQAQAGQDADYRLGLAYRNGDGVARDPAAAVRSLRSAAERGVAPAMFILSHMLAEGEGTARDPVAARRWLDAAGQEEYPEALQELAMEERDPARAAELLRLAGHAMQHRARDR
jgi:TPR repeat protein